MKLRKIAALFTALVLCLCLSSCAWNSDPTPLLYKVTDTNGNTVWLFGSIHVATEDLYPLPDYVMDAYNDSVALAVECDVLAEQDDPAIEDAATKMLYTDGTTIADHIDSELYDQAVTILKDEGVYSELLDLYTPVMWSNTIDNLSIVNMGYDGDIGIDVHLLETAKAEGKEIREIESVAFQYNMLASFSPAVQEFLLENSVASYDNPLGSLSFAMLASAWKSGDEESLTMLLTSTTEGLAEEDIALYEEYNKALLTDRNITMTDYAEEALLSGGDLFICVGAAHVVGEGGMVDLLEERGYTVETVTAPEE